jgi:hypothetical protein
LNVSCFAQRIYTGRGSGSLFSQIVPQASAELQSARRQAKARAAIAEAEPAELLARLPPSSIKPLRGSIDTRQFGTTGLVKAFDLARELASEVCTALPADRMPRSTSRPPRASQPGQILDAIERLRGDLARQNKELQQVIDAHTPQGIAYGDGAGACLRRFSRAGAQTSSPGSVPAISARWMQAVRRPARARARAGGAAR